MANPSPQITCVTCLLKGICHLFINLGAQTARMRFTRLFVLIVLVLSFQKAQAQQAAALDSMKMALGQAKTPEMKSYWLDMLSRTAMNVSLKDADEYGRQLISIAEETRDRKMMFDAYLSNGTRCSYFSGSKDYANRAIQYFNTALEMARQNKMDEQEVMALLKLSVMTLTIPDNEKALNYVTKASAMSGSVKNDSLKAEIQNTYGQVYLSKNDKILALGSYLNGLRIAEEVKPENAALLRTSYMYLSHFYGEIDDYDRAIDYYKMGYDKLDKMIVRFVPYQRAIDMNAMGKLFAAKKNYDIAIEYFRRSLAMADSLKFSTLKIPAYSSIIDQYLQMDQPQQALDYFNSAEGMALKKYLTDFGFASNIDMAYGNIFTKLQQYDSARVRFDRAASFYEKESNPILSMYYYVQRATFYKKIKDYPRAIADFVKVKGIAQQTSQLEFVQRSAKNLDSLYRWTNNFEQANIYNGIYHEYKDSILTLSKEKELAQLEANDEHQRQIRIESEAAEKKRKRYNIQYLGIVIGIVVLFISLVMLGMFKVSKTTIKMIGFFAFLMFFEFIFLIFKKNITRLTGGEPMKDLLFMIALAALLLPLHHWLEHKVIHYLTSHNRLTSAGLHIRRKLFGRSKVEQH